MLYSLLVIGCGASSSEPGAAPASDGPAAAAPAGAKRDTDVAELKSALDAGKVPVLIDVRTRDEYGSGHVPGARNIPVAELGMHTSTDLAPFRGEEVWLICQSGGRSSRGASTLAAAGFHTVNVKGGTSAWQAAGYPTE
ncbi:MAG: rhodanese-like domain-containing protein [Myxococcota bacterium]